MPKVLVLGGGVVGLATGMLMAREGHDVTLLERDPHDAPDDVWADWDRKGVAQFNQGHFTQARFRHVLEAELPEVAAHLDSRGATRFSFADAALPSMGITEPGPEFKRYESLTARRAVLEGSFASVARETPNLNIRRGTAAVAPIFGEDRIDGVLHFDGVMTDSGEKITADLIIDAMGRKSCFSEWVSDAGGRAPAQTGADCGFMYYTRHFRSPDGSHPAVIGPPNITYGSFGVLTLPGDNGTWMVIIHSSSGDTPLKQLRHADKWTKVVSSCPLQTHWLDGEAMHDVLPMAGIVDRRKRFVVDGLPVATGMIAVSDAWACTNPSAGRGLSVGLAHAVRLRDVARDHFNDPVALAREFDAVTEREFTPWFETQREADRATHERMEAARTGAEPEPDDSPGAELRNAFWSVMSKDVELFKYALEITGCLTTPQEIFARPELAEHVFGLATDVEAEPPPGPSRSELLDILA